MTTVKPVGYPACRCRGRGVGAGNRIVDARPPRQGRDGVGGRSISTGQLHPLRGVHVRPINPVVCGGPHPAHRLDGELILKQASRLDAFSGYPSRT